MTHQLSFQEPKIQVIDNQVLTSSLDVAKFFGKNHKNVLQTIQGLDLPGDFNRLNFQPVEYLDAKGEKRPAYNMTRDGFVILVMGFTGKEAMQWKIRYIQAFNAMEAELFGKTEKLQLDAPLTKDQRKRVSGLVSIFSQHSHYSRMECWQLVHAKFEVATVEDLKASQYQAIVDWLEAQSRLNMPEVDFITRQALAGVKAFTARLTVEEAISKTAKAVHREFKANIYITEEKPKHEIAAYLDAMTGAHQKRLNRAGIR